MNFQEAEYRQLDALGVKAKTDKSSLHHNYTKIYAHYFHHLKELPIKFLEIGILQGASVLMWEEYFPKADLHFIDINKDQIIYHSTRSHYHFLDQSKPEDLNKFIAKTGGKFDVIIDDGGHLMNQQIISFLHLFPTLNSGGIYVIEDLHTSYWQQFGGGGSFSHPHPSSSSTTEFLKNLIDDINYVGAKTTCASHDKTPVEIRLVLNYFQEHLLSLHFYDSLCIAIKK